jgi:hypothetical protein
LKRHSWSISSSSSDSMSDGWVCGKFFSEVCGKVCSEVWGGIGDTVGSCDGVRFCDGVGVVF